jgi:hypothetical protein
MFIKEKSGLDKKYKELVDKRLMKIGAVSSLLSSVLAVTIMWHGFGRLAHAYLFHATLASAD